MGRRVGRQHTRKAPSGPPAPWTLQRRVVSEDDPNDIWFEPRVWATGPPRFMRSNYAIPVVLNSTEVGLYDPLYRAYSHWGLTKHSAHKKVDGKWFIFYHATEWQVVLDGAFWIEFVSESEEAVARISRENAVRSGHQTAEGFWAVPFTEYEVVRQRGTTTHDR